MPELPEVEVVRLGLEPAVTGASIEHVEVRDVRSLRRHRGASDDFVNRLAGRNILAASRRGKFLWLPLSPFPLSPLAESAPAESLPAEALVVHLGMSGQVLLRERETEDKLTRIRIDIAHPTHGQLRLNFADQRIFGSMAIDELVPATDLPGQMIPSQVAHIARDPMDEHFQERTFYQRLGRRATGIKRALLDQTLISGIGNIYADEALWAAKIHYNQQANELTRPRAKKLLSEVRLVLGKALAEGGTSFDAQYVNVDGASGYFVHSLNAYGRHGAPCPRCGRPIIRESFMNRGSHFCAFCQRLPKQRSAQFSRSA